MSSMRELQTRQEARFVLWALRSALCGARGDESCARELELVFDLAGVADTSASFHALARTLFAVDWPLAAWHGPRCGCMSTEEFFVLNALAEVAARQRQHDANPAAWWRAVLPAQHIAAVDAAARSWLAELECAGVAFPTPEHLHACLRPLESIAGPAPAMPVH